MRCSLLLLLVSTLAIALLAAGAATPAFAADSDGPVDFGDDGPVDFGENDAESRLFAQNVACQPPNRSKTTYSPDRYVWVDGPYFVRTGGFWHGCGRDK